MGGGPPHGRPEAALSPCPKCGGEVPAGRATCPECLRTTRSNIKRGAVAGGLGLAAAFAFVGTCALESASRPGGLQEVVYMVGVFAFGMAILAFALCLIAVISK